MSQKSDIFFELIRAVYGASRYEAQWPDDTHEQAAKLLWEERIERHSEAELKAALENAQRMSSNGEKDWQWPNIGLILSGARRYNAPAHRTLLTGTESEEEKQRKRDLALKNVSQIKMLLTDEPPF